MGDARVDHIEDTLNSLGQKVDGLSMQLHEASERLDGRIDALAVEMRAGFGHTQAAFDDHRQYAEFLTEAVQEQMSVRFNHVERRFDSMDERFDRMDKRFGRMDERFDRMDERFDRMDERFDRTDECFDRTDERFDRTDGRFDRIDDRFDRLEQLIKER